MRFRGENMRKVTLLKRSVEQDDSNQPIETWTSQGEIYMEWWDQGGKEALESGQMIAVKDVRGKCRYVDGLNERDYRIEKDGQSYDIQNIKEIGRREGQMIIMDHRDNQ